MSMDGIFSYMPANILSYIMERTRPSSPYYGQPIKAPLQQTFDTVCLFADVSGYTRLCEEMAKKGPKGDETLARALNSYFEQLLRIISSQGGDVFKFAGDAVMALWPKSEESLQDLARRAGQCALEITSKLNDVQLAENVRVSVTVGIGVGTTSVLHVGGVFSRLEYLATGPPLQQAFRSEHLAQNKEVIASPEAWALIQEHFTAEMRDNFAVLTKCTDPLRKMSVFKALRIGNSKLLYRNKEIMSMVKNYVPSAIEPFVREDGELWASELRRITTLFVNVSLGDDMIGAVDVDDIDTIQTVVSSVQRAVYRYEGSLNKFLMDDKGSTLIAVFGLPPLAHEDDAIRGVLASLAICAQLHEQGLSPSIGVTTGVAFCGVVGSRHRREYSVLGDAVNLSARLMQKATAMGGGILCDKNTQYSARNRLIFEKLPSIIVKGKADPVKVYHPYPKQLAHIFANKGKPLPKKLRAKRSSSRMQRSMSVSASMSRSRGISYEIGNSLYRSGLDGRNERARFASILSIFDTFDHDTIQEETTDSSVNTRRSSMLLGRGDGYEPGKAFKRALTEPAVEEMDVRELSKMQADIARHRGTSKDSKRRSVDVTNNIVDKIHSYQMEGYAQQHFLKLQQERTKANRGDERKRSKRLSKPRGSTKDLIMTDALQKAMRREQDEDKDHDSGAESDDEAEEGPMTHEEDRTAADSKDVDEYVDSYQSPVKAVRVILPNKRGTITVQVYDLKTVAQVKARVFERCISRKLLPDDAQINEYCFLFAGTSIGLSDLFPLTTIPSILSTHDLPSSTVLELQLVSISVAQGQWYASESTEDLSTLSRPLSQDDVKATESVPEEPNESKTDEEEDDEASVSEYVLPIENSPSTQLSAPGPEVDKLVLSAQDQKKMDEMVWIDQDLRHRMQVLVKDKQGCTIILEGEVGLGKSHILRSTVMQAPSSVLLLCGAGNPFEMGKPLAVWADIVSQALEAGILAANNGEKFPEPIATAKRTEYVTSLLKDHAYSAAIHAGVDTSSAGTDGEQRGSTSGRGKTMEVLGSLLNDLLRLAFEENPYTMALTEQQQLNAAISAILAIMKSVTLDRPVAVVLDDAVFLDKASWRLAFHMSQQVEGMLLVLATRPINKSYMAAFAHAVPQEYILMSQDPNVQCVKLTPRPDEVIYQMACDALEVAQIPPILAALVLQRSNGNPLVVKEFVYALKEKRLVAVDPTTHECVLDKTLEFTNISQLSASYEVPVPITLQAILGSQLDRLTHEQSMLLKTAAVIGEEFSFELIVNAYPLKVKQGEDEMAAAMCPLIVMNIIHFVDRTKKKTSGSLGPDSASGIGATRNQPAKLTMAERVKAITDRVLNDKDAKFSFTHGFMRSMVLNRMLSEQRSRLGKMVKTSRAAKAREKSHNLHMSTVFKKQGPLQVRDEGTEEFVTKYVVLTDAAVIVWPSKELFETPAAERGRPDLLLVLDGASIDRGSDAVTFKLTVNEFLEIDIPEDASAIKNQPLRPSVSTSVYRNEQKIFVFLEDEKIEFTSWLRNINRVIVSQGSKQRRHMMELARKTLIWKQQRLRLGLEMQEPMVDETPFSVQAADRKEMEAKFIDSVMTIENGRHKGGLLISNVEIRKIRGFFFTEWKSRWLTLTPDAIYIRRNEQPSFPSKPITEMRRAKPSFTDVIALNTFDVVVELGDFDREKKVHTFTITCQLWLKRNKVMWKTRVYTIGVHSEAQAENWVSTIHKVIEFHRTTLLASHRAKNMPSKSKQAKGPYNAKSRQNRMALASRSVHRSRQDRIRIKSARGPR